MTNEFNQFNLMQKIGHLHATTKVKCYFNSTCDVPLAFFENQIHSQISTIKSKTEENEENMISGGQSTEAYYMVPQGSEKIRGSPDENEDLPNGFLI